MPYQGSSFDLARSLVYPVAGLDVLVPESDMAMTSDDLSDAGLVTGGDGTDYRRLTGSNLSAGAEIAIRFDGIPLPQNPATAPQPVPVRSPLTGYELIAGGGVLLLASAVLLWRRRAGEGETMETAFDPDDESAAG